MAGNPERVACVRCHHVGPKGHQYETRSSGAGLVFILGLAALLFVPLIGLTLLLAAFLLGLFGGKTIWHASCRLCGATEVVPLSSPEGRRIAEAADADSRR